MLGELSGVAKIFIITGRTDMRKSFDGLMAIIRDTYQLDPYANALYLFCGRDSRKLKALHYDKLSADFCYPYILLFYSVTHGMSEKSKRIKIYDVSSF